MGTLRYLFLFLCFSGYSLGLIGQTPVTYFFADQTVCTNDTVRLPFQVRNFMNVRNFQSSVRWNPGSLVFQSLDEIHPQLANNFLINTDSVNTGGVGYFWLDNSSGDPLILADSSVLFVLKFISIGIETTIEVGFGEVPTLTETVIENNGIPIQVTSAQIPGFITINEITAEAEIQPATSGNNGQINLTPTTGQVPFTFLWNTGAITEDLDNLAPDNYSVTIIDALGCTASFDYLVEMNTSIENNLSNTLSITPNPTHDYLSIDFIENDLNSIYQYYLYDLEGNLIFQKNNINSELIESINLQNQSSGLYFLEIKTKKNTQVFKIIKN